MAVISRLLYQCTTNCVDVNWTVTVIIRFQLVSELNVDETVYSSASTLLWTWITVADGRLVGWLEFNGAFNTM